MLIEKIADVQKQLLRAGLDGWLLYDYCGSNPIARHALGLGQVIFTRRLFYLIPAKGVPTLFYHRLDAHQVPPLPGRHLSYIGWRDLDDELDQLCRKLRKREGCVTPRLAMEYYPGGSLPDLSRVDAGTIEWIKQKGFLVEPSADLVQQFLCRLTDAQAEAHREVALMLDGIKERAFEQVRRRLADGRPLAELELQQYVMQQLSEGGLVTDYPPVVAAGANTANPHHLPSRGATHWIDRDQVVMIDLAARLDQPVCAYADITWVGYTGSTVPAQLREVFELVLRARDAGLDVVRKNWDADRGVGPRGWEVDRAVRDVIEAEGYGSYFPHRAGHSLGILHGHGDGPNIDDLETHDTRQLLQGICFSLKPGVYLEEFGVRSEVDVYLAKDGPEVRSPMQKQLILLG